jgi:hypothetical protein
MVNVENGKQKAQEQADEKVFLAFGLRQRASELMLEGPTVQL